MATVRNPGIKPPRAIRFQYNGRLDVLPVGLSEWPADLALYLQRKYAGLGVRIVPSPEEVAADEALQAQKLERRNTPRPKNRAEYLARRKPPVVNPAVALAEELKAIAEAEASHVGAVEADVVPEPEIPAVEEAQPVAPADGSQES